MENSQPLLPNKVYHLFTHAVDKTNLFFRERNYHYMLKKWQEHSKGKFNTYAYCFMPNHIHLCVQTLEFESAKPKPIKTTHHSKVVNNFLSAYVQAVNKQENRKGALVRSRFGRLEVNNCEYFRDLICYIHHNPIHHFEMYDYDTWAHTSYHDFLNLKNTIQEPEPFLRSDIVLRQFKNEFNEYHQNYKAKKKYLSYQAKIQEIFTKL
ncbi:MAG: hypothetical protein RLZZ628_1364 [Bacteroidota bacterium]|jgi:REP element-mobilizing transposase RayT